MITAKGTKLAYAMCIGCPVDESIKESFCHKNKGQVALEKGNKCYLDEQTKTKVVCSCIIGEDDCPYCGGTGVVKVRVIGTPVQEE